MLTLLSSFAFSFPVMPFSQQSLSSFSIFILNVSTVETCGCLVYQVVFFLFSFIAEHLMSTGNGFIFRGKELNHFLKFMYSCLRNSGFEGK